MSCRTVDALSGGRLLLGVGVGWLKEEAEALGIPFAARGARTDEAIDAMRTLWREEVASFRGRYVRFEGVKMRPKPVRPAGVPIIIGGHSAAAARRAGRRGDGFYPLGVGVEALPRLLAILRAEAEKAGRDPAAIELTVRAPGTLDEAQRLRELGASRFVIGARPADDLDAVRRSVADYRERVIARLS